MARQTESKEINQCMGCQAGWARNKNKRGNWIHWVPKPGYEDEIVSCTKDRYEVPKQP